MKNTSIFTLTHPKGSERVYRAKDGSQGSHVCLGDVGYISGTAWGLMAIMLDDFTDQEAWQIVNISDNQSNFLASVAVLGATGDEHAVNMALRTFNGDLGNIGQANSYEVVTAPIFVLKRLLDSDSRAAFKSRITQNELSQLYRKLTMNPVEWNETQVASHSSPDALMSDMVRYDEFRELQTPVTANKAFAPLLDGSEMGQYDAIVTQVSRLDALSNRILVSMGKAADKVKPVKVEKTDPFKKHGVVNVAQHFTFEDGQSVTIVYHNPDSTPNRLDAKDLLTSWKFMLNSRDVTAALQPKSGKNVDIPQLAKRVILLVEANSARFVRSQERKIRAQKVLEELNQIEAEKHDLIAALDKEIAELQAELDKPIAEYVADDSHGTIVGQKEKGSVVLDDKTYPRDKDGNLLNHTGEVFKTRVVAEKTINKLGLVGYVVKVAAPGYVIAELSDPTYKTNGYVTVGNALYGDHILKAQPKLLFEVHNREFLVVESQQTGTLGKNIEVVELRGRASIPSKDDKGKDQFFYNSVVLAYQKTLEVLAGMSSEEFNATTLAKRKEVELTNNILIAEGEHPQPAEVVRERHQQKLANKTADRQAALNAKRDANGRLDPYSEDPMERLQAYEEMSYSEKLDDVEKRTAWLTRTQELTAEEFSKKIEEQRLKVIHEEANSASKPNYIQANQALYTEYKKQYESNLDNPDSNLVAAYKAKLDRQKDLLQSNGIAIEEAEGVKAPEVTRYDIKNPNPRRRKALGLVKLTKRGDSLFDVMLQQGTVGGEYTGDVYGIKRWLSVRMQSLGDAMNDQQNDWERVAAQLELTAGDDVLNVNMTTGQDLKVQNDKGALPEGVTEKDLARRKDLDSITKNLRAMAQEESPRNWVIGGKSYNSRTKAMIALAEKLAEMSSVHTDALDVADILQHELNQNLKLRQYVVVMPRMGNVTKGNIKNKLRRIDKAFKEAGVPITLRQSIGDNLLLSGEKPFSRVQFNYDPTYGEKPYFVMQADRMDGQEYGDLINALMAYLNEDYAIEGKPIYFSRDPEVIDTATNQLGDALKSKFQALKDQADSKAAAYREARKDPSASQPNSPSFEKYSEVARQFGHDVKENGLITKLNGQDSAFYVKLDGDTLRIVDVLGNEPFTGTATPETLEIFFTDYWGEKKINPAASQGEELSLKEIREKGLEALKKVKKFLGRMQHDTIQGFIKRGEESAFYANKMIELLQQIDAMPVTYQTDGQGKKALAQLHYFRGNMDWYITEKDVEGGVQQAYGYVNAGHGLEGGYINIEEVASVNAELDLYFDPISIHAVEGTEPEETEDNSVMQNQKDAQFLDQVLSGEISSKDVDMKDLEAMAVKYGDDQDSEIFTKLEKVVGIAISAKIEKAKAIQ